MVVRARMLQGVATTAMTFGVGGAVLFSPIFIIVFPLVGVPTLDPATSFGAALLTELVGFASGLVGYSRKGLIDWTTGRHLCCVGVPMAVAGAGVKRQIAPLVLLFAFAIGMLLLALFVWANRENEEGGRAAAAPTASKSTAGVAPASAALQSGVAPHPVKAADSFSGNSSGRASETDASGMTTDASQDPEAALAGASDAFLGTGLTTVVPEAVGGDGAAPAAAAGSDDAAAGRGARAHDAPAVTKGQSAPIRAETGHMMSPHRRITDKAGNTYVYKLCRPIEGMILLAIGSLVTGVLSVGVGETAVSVLRARCRVPMRVATGTSVFVVTVTVLSAAAADVLIEGIGSVPWELVAFTMPGVLIGGQIGACTSSKVSSHTAERALVALFAMLGLVMGGIAIDRAVSGEA